MKFHKTHKAGFTLIELLVVLGIFIIITAVVLARQNRFSSDILLTDSAYQVAISVRQAQVYGLSVRGSNTGGSTLDYQTGYGLHFSTPVPLTSYSFFPDLDENGTLGVTSDGVNESSASGFSTLTLNKARISDVCGTTFGSPVCLSSRNINFLDIVYIRPNHAAVITDNLGQSTTNGFYTNLVITVQSLLGDRYKCVTAYSTGQVSVSAPTGSNPSNPCI